MGVGIRPGGDAGEVDSLLGGALVDREVSQCVKSGRLVGQLDGDKCGDLGGIVAFQPVGIDRRGGEIVGATLDQVGDGHSGSSAGGHDVGVRGAGTAIVNVVVGDDVRAGAWVPGQRNRAGCPGRQRC